ncbi:hypothetical protein BX666DRAFT_814898 [Dichotomocladium elegans]|nr:hypothetical protein BX666DRAFT_814898 [Dichotomocladium elegans]
MWMSRNEHQGRPYKETNLGDSFSTLLSLVLHLLRSCLSFSFISLFHLSKLLIAFYNTYKSMPFLSLPTELLLHIIQYLCYENHLDLVPIASTCQQLHHVAADWTIWSRPVRVVIDQSSPFTTRDLFKIIQATPRDDLHTNHVILAIEAASSADQAAEFLHHLIATRSIHTLQVHAPSSIHGRLLEYPSFHCVDSVTIQDSCDEYSNQIDLVGHRIHLPHSHTLRIIDLPTCTVHPWLHGDYVFPQVTSLTIMATESIDGRRFKQTFPKLKILVLHLACAAHVSLIRPLLTDKRLYPWIEQLSVVCKDDLRSQLGKHEIKEFLMSLDGVSRLNLGWDMIALSSV